MWRRVDDHDGVITDFHFDEAEDRVIIRTGQDCAEILDHNRAMQGHTDGFSASRDFRRIASIPLNVLAQWSQEAGVDLNAMRKHDRIAFIKRKLRDPDWQHLRNSPGRI